MSVVSNNHPEVIESCRFDMTAEQEADVLAGGPESPEPTEAEINAMANAAGQLLTYGGDTILEILPEDAPAPCRQVAAPTDARQARQPRKPRSRPARSVRLITPPLAGVPGIIAITVGKNLFTYWLSPLAADFGRAFRLEKFGDGGESYAVNLGGDGHHPSCECPGFEKWGCNQKDGHACKHLDGVRALVQAGKL